MRLYLLGLLALFSSVTAAYTLEQFQFDDPKQTLQFQKLIEELRCLVCQNESLASSQADLAQDLRAEVYEMMQSGKSREEIVDFLVARYGDFVLYDPPLKPATYPLWFGPLLLGILGLLIWVRVIRSKKRAADRELSEAERQRLQELLQDANGDGKQA